ncbi:MAG: PAS domain-containing protein [Methanoculleaceae archaeon]
MDRPDELRQRLDRIMATGSTTWWEMDHLGAFIRFGDNVKDLLGYPREHLTNYSEFTTIIHPDDSSRALEGMQDLITGKKERFDLEIRIRTAGGEYRWFHHAGEVIMTHPDGTPAMVGGTLTDVTDLVLADRKLNLLLSATRHDINNEIMILQGYLSLAREEVEDPVIKGYLDMADEALEKIIHHVRFSRDWQYTGVRPPVWHNLKDAVSSRLSDSSLSITIDLDDLLVYADPLLPEVFAALMDETIRGQNSVTGIHICYRREGEDLILTWEEEGRGDPAGLNLSESSLIIIREILSITGIDITWRDHQGGVGRFEIRVPENAWKIDDRRLSP